MNFAMVFPGQGSQAIGMFDAYGDAPEVVETIRQGGEILGQDVAKLVREGPAESLSLTTNTQPLMVIAGIAAFRLWQARGGAEPVVVAGHSLGEYSALVAAGALSFEDCLPLVRLRAQAMQDAVPKGQGAMAAILGLDDDRVREACTEAAHGEVVEAVNFNAPSQVVIAGHAAAVQRASELAKAKGAKRAVILPVSAPFHSSLMGPAAARLKDCLSRIMIDRPRIPVIHNFDVAEHPEPDAIRAALVAQADHPVRWVDTIKRIAERGVTSVLECGPGKVLAPLAKRIDDRLSGVALVDRTAIEQCIATMQAGAA
jgi:[acyl-carrier-protein] S-malonyltransferase